MVKSGKKWEVALRQRIGATLVKKSFMALTYTPVMFSSQGVKGLMTQQVVIRHEAPTQEVREFIGQHVDTPTKLQLLIFWGKHPDTKFTERTLRHALGEDAVGVVENNLEDLARCGLVKKHIHPHRDAHFSLATVRETRSVVIELSKCSQYELRRWRDLPWMRCFQPVRNS